MRRLLSAGSLPLIAVLAGACSDAGPSTMSQVGFNTATQSPPVAASTGAAFAVNGTPESFTDLSGNVLVINGVELVLREIELHRAGAVTDCAPGTSDECEELEIGPVLLDLPLGTPGA